MPAKDDSLFSHIVACKYVITRFKMLKDISAVAIEGVLMYHKDGLVLPGLGCNSHLAFHLFASSINSC
jgi:hypothetical protein